MRILLVTSRGEYRSIRRNCGNLKTYDQRQERIEGDGQEDLQRRGVDSRRIQERDPSLRSVDDHRAAAGARGSESGNEDGSEGGAENRSEGENGRAERTPFRRRRRRH